MYLKYIFLLFMFIMSGYFSACSNEHDDVDFSNTNFVLEMETLNFMQQASEITFRVKSKFKPKISCKQDWVSFELCGMTETIYKLIVKVAENSSGATRKAVIDISSGEEIKQCFVYQSAIRAFSPYEIADRLGLGWNAGNQMEAYSNDIAIEPDNGFNQEFFNKIKAAGFKSVRLPVTWFGHIGDAPDYDIDNRLDRVVEIVGYAEKAGLNIIINIHHDGEGGGNRWLDFKTASLSEEQNQKIIGQFVKVWKQIAERFVDTGDFLIFESMNEIHDGSWGYGSNLSDGGHQYRIIDQWNQAFVDAVRSTGGENTMRYLAIPGMCANWQLTVNHLTLPNDPTQGRLMVSIHCYEPMDFSYDDGKGSYYTEWGHTASEEKASPSGIKEEELSEMFKKIRERFIDNNIPVYIGEFTCTNRKPGREAAFRRYYLEYFCKSAHDNGLIPFYWDNSGTGVGVGQSAIFDRMSGSFVQDNEFVVKTMLKAVSDNTDEYTLQSVYDSAPEQEN